MAERKHLWEVDHPYYCNEGNYFASGGQQPYQEFKTLGAFLNAEADAELDMNLVFRWDWLEGEDHGAEEYNGDPYFRNGVLKIFIMGQRKGLFRWVTVQVCRADEPKVVEYLRPRFAHMMKLWAPLSPSTPDSP